METAVGISLFTCAGMLTSILFKPSVNVKKHNVSIYWMVVLLGAAALILSGCISLKEVFEGLSADTAVNPVKILVLFFSMSVLSVFLDEVGFFRYMACLTLSRANASQKKLFVCLFVIGTYGVYLKRYNHSYVYTVHMLFCKERGYRPHTLSFL